jgi:hypothetical protein
MDMDSAVATTKEDGLRYALKLPEWLVDENEKKNDVERYMMLLL